MTVKLCNDISEILNFHTGISAVSVLCPVVFLFFGAEFPEICEHPVSLLTMILNSSLTETLPLKPVDGWIGVTRKDLTVLHFYPRNTNPCTLYSSNQDGPSVNERRNCQNNFNQSHHRMESPKSVASR